MEIQAACDTLKLFVYHRVELVRGITVSQPTSKEIDDRGIVVCGVAFTVKSNRLGKISV